MTYTKIFLFCLFIFAFGMAGCVSNTSTTSGYGGGSGYQIKLTATQTILPSGGSTVLIASVKDNNGVPVNDSSRGVTFTSSQGGAFPSIEGFINLGVCNATYQAPTTVNTTAVVDQITASYQGAFAYISIEVYKQ